MQIKAARNIDIRALNFGNKNVPEMGLKPGLV